MFRFTESWRMPEIKRWILQKKHLFTASAFWRHVEETWNYAFNLQVTIRFNKVFFSQVQLKSPFALPMKNINRHKDFNLFSGQNENSELYLMEMLFCFDLLEGFPNSRKLIALNSREKFPYFWEMKFNYTRLESYVLRGHSKNYVTLEGRSSKICSQNPAKNF